MKEQFYKNKIEELEEKIAKLERFHMSDSLEKPKVLNSFAQLQRINPVLYELFCDAAQKIVDKNTDYAGMEDFYKNFRMSENIGIPAWQAIFVRFGDKVRRIENFIKNKGVMAVKDESFRDTCIDGANYLLLMFACYIQGKTKIKVVDQRDAP